MARGCRELSRRGGGGETGLVVVALAVFLMQLSTVQALNIITPPEDVVVTRGDPFNLTCVATGDPPPTIIWEGEDGVFLNNGHVVDNDLIFQGALPDHAGVYTCVASNGDTSVTASATVTVNYSPKFLSLEAEPAEEVVNGTMVTLTCNMNGFPTPNVTWFHNGQEVVESQRVMVVMNGSVLMLAAVLLCDAGVYSCNGTNSLGTVESDTTVLLRVYYPPMNIMIHASPPDLVAMLGERVVLTCHAAAMPEANYSWWREEAKGREVLVEETSEIMMFDGNGTLLFDRVRREDAGNYFCIASNGFGNVSSNSVTLHVSAVPLPPGGVSLTPPTSSSVTVEWPTITGSYPPITMYHVEFRLNFHGRAWMGESVDSVTTSLEITGLLPYAPYQVRVSATSPAGRGDTSPHVSFTTDTGVPKQFNTPQDLAVSSSGPRSITVQWTVHPDIEDTSYAFTCITVTSAVTPPRTVEGVGGVAGVEVVALMPNTLYLVTLMLRFEGGGLGPPVEQQTTTLEDAPESPPQNLTVSNVTATSATVSWSPPLTPNGNITSYNLSYLPADDSESATGREVGGATLSLVVTELHPFTEYNVSVSASTAEGEGPAQTTSFTTLEAAPGAPRIIEEFAISSSALMLSWKLEGRVPGVLTGYNVTYRTVGGDPGFKELPPNNESVVVSGLRAWSEYEVCVSAATQGGGPGNTSCTLLRTLPAAPELELMIETVTALCPPSLSVTWQPVTSDLLYRLNGPLEDAVYTIRWREEEGSGETSSSQNVSFSTNKTDFLIPALKVDTRYNVFLAVSNSNGTGPPSDPFSSSIPTQPAPPVTDLKAEPGPTYLDISVEAPPLMSPFRYFTYIYTITRSSPSVPPPVRTPDTSHTFSDLTPATQYTVSVVVDGGCGQSTEVNRSVTTLEAPPGPPEVTIATVSASSVAVQWSKPDMPNGVITEYMVVCGEGGGERVLASDNYHVCDELAAETAVAVTVWAANGAGRGESRTVSTSTACDSKVPEVSVKGEEVTVVISEGCSGEAHLLVVVQEVGSGETRPLATYSVEDLIKLTREYSREQQRRQVSQATVYITAQLTRDSSSSFRLGDGQDRGGYINYPLEEGAEYIVGVVGVPDNPNRPDVFTSSQKSFRSPTTATDEPSSDDEADFPVILVAAVGGGALFVLVAVVTLAMVTLVCCRRRRHGTFSPDMMQGKGSSQSFERSSSVRLSGRRGNKPADPVEEYRAIYHTEALESHPPVPIDGFINKLLVMRTNDNQLFLEEFGSIDMSPQQPCSVAELPANRSKNRYHNILPYDHSRVKLSHSKGQADYINASYCSGFMKVQGFIATQGPLPDTVPDFWRLVWEQNAHTIVMLTNAQERLKTKCEVYWPREVGCSVLYGGMEVTLTDFTQLADYTVRSLTINKAGSGKDVREVRQFHFTSWPDHGVPQYATAMLAMVRRVQAFHTVERGPMVVHCSAGVGRTGTFTVIYSMLERMKAGKTTVDIYGHVSLLRTQRNYMVQTEDQYFFIYEAVAEAIVCGDTEVLMEQLDGYVADILSVANENIDHTNIELQFKRLAVDKSDAYRFASANKDVNKAKNRYVNVLPYETRRVILQYQRAQEGSDYINASFIDGYHYRHAFIATQGPLQNTLADFWRMVWEHNVPVIVMLTKCHEKGTERSAQYWPQEVGQSLVCGLYSVEMTVERRSEHYTYRDLLLVDTQSGRKRQVRHFHFLSWPEVGMPSSSHVLLDFLREVQKNFATLNTKSPVTVHCSNGIGRTGIFIALHILLERMVTEGLVDVFQTVKNLRIQRPAMVQTLEQYQFCYTAALDYLESSDLLNQLKSSTRSDSHSNRASSNASDLRSSRRSLNRNDSLRSSAKRSSRNLELSSVGNGVSTTVYGVSEATSTFGTAQHSTASPRTSLDSSSAAQRTAQGVADLGDGSGTPVPTLHSSPQPPTASPSPRLLVNPHLAHLDTGSLSQGSSSGAGSVPQLLAATGSYHTLSQGAAATSHPALHTNTLPTRGGGGGASGLVHSHWGMAGGSASQSSLGHTVSGGVAGGGAYPVSSFKGRTSGGQSTSQDSLEKQLATLALNLNSSNNNNFVDVYVEP